MKITNLSVIAFRFRGLPALLLPTVLLTGCAAQALVGTVPSATPPQLVVLAAKGQDGKEVLTWDRPMAFGPVPAHLKALGDVSCLRTRVDLEAIGYHPSALDRDGKPMLTGGFFCAPKLHGSAPGRVPPQIVLKDRVLGWDRPSAFGAVPKEQLVRGRTVCATLDPTFEAIGYHPQAKDITGKPIPDGGFFCAKPVNQEQN